MALVLTAAELAALAAFDVYVDTAFAGGLSNGVDIVVPPLSGYTGLSDALKLLARQAFEVALIPLLRQSPWIEIGSAGAPSFQNGWTNFGSTLATVAYYVDSFGVVHLKGTAKLGSIGGAIFTLPAAYAPVGDRTFAVDTGNGTATGEVVVSSSGTVTPFSPSSNSRVHLDAIQFRP